ncbi:6-carboxytetrahydropterin synthase [Wenzhouxiangella sediminis]|uniref:6-carboxy-5,6,7,8-tetrahydropterin synthase n=1 Tax=Wenzhouxiangella sediminis TaxID=1792836 RepID=A0A3E1K9Z3_9GAMM|nr:6-carboxytetrahydropterin synthase [Wenzhouxiangella sediminis]RFF31080.1 6-pyruvoyl tetrahydropterin synthase [Wenzhouxiangella sediminis]
MNAHSLFLTALRPFEAARRLAVADGERLHGHGFEARIFAAAASCPGDFPGDETRALGAILDEAVAPLDYALVNELIGAPDDARIAEWLLERAASAQPHAIVLRSAPDRGAVVEPGKHPLAWRRFRFESAHRLPSVPRGHKCGRMHGHGFEAVIHARVDAGQDAWRTQDRIAEAWQPVHEQIHFACLNDLPGLDNPTSEVLARWLWQNLTDVLPGLTGISVLETASAGCHYDGRTWRIWKAMSFDSAVRLARAPQGDPRRLLHGHTFTTRLHLAGGLDEVMGWVHDYGDVKQRFDPLFRELDHQPLHQKAGLEDNDPAAIARHIEARMAAELPGLSRIDVLEKPGHGALLLRGGSTRGLLVP